LSSEIAKLQFCINPHEHRQVVTADRLLLKRECLAPTSSCRVAIPHATARQATNHFRAGDSAAMDVLLLGAVPPHFDGRTPFEGRRRLKQAVRLVGQAPTEDGSDGRRKSYRRKLKRAISRLLEARVWILHLFILHPSK